MNCPYWKCCNCDIEWFDQEQEDALDNKQLELEPDNIKFKNYIEHCREIRARKRMIIKSSESKTEIE